MIGTSQSLFPQNRRWQAVLCAIVGALLLLHWYGGTMVTISPVKILIQPRLALQGTTHLMLPPVGEISAHTHWVPLRLNIYLRHVDLTFLEELWYSGQFTEEDLFALLKGMRLSLILLILHLIGIGSLGAVLGLLVVGFRTPREIKMGILVGILTPVLLLGGVYLTYDVGAFNTPKYAGVIQGAPWMLDFIQENVSKMGEFSSQLQMVAGNLVSFLDRLEELRGLSVPAGEVTVLHVSDLHNNPAALDFVLQIVDSFHVDVIIDTGDLTDLGTPLEAELVGRIGEFPVPYVFVPGNHETPQITNRLKAMSNVIVLEDAAVEVAGLWIYGVNDPVATVSSPEPWTLDALQGLIPAIEAELAALPRLDILAVHHDWLAKHVETTAQVVLCGHSHVSDVAKVEGRIVVNAGTTGAAGVRGFLVEGSVPYTVALLHFSSDETGNLVLWAIDSVEVDVVAGGFSLQRNLVQTLEDAAERGIGRLLSN